MIATTAIAVLLVVPAPSCGQLLGHFSFVPLPDGYEYRDGETVAASQQAARLGERVYREEEFQADSRRRSNEYDILSNIVPQFETSSHGLKIGRTLHDSKIFDRWDTNFLNPFTETRSNKPLEELLVEDHTSPIRLLPGEGLPPTPPPPTRLPVNRLQNRNRPVEESERAKNSRLGTYLIRRNTDLALVEISCQESEKTHTLQENIPLENISLENISPKNSSLKNILIKNISPKNRLIKSISLENISRKNISQENIFPENISLENILLENIFLENISLENILLENILQDNIFQ